MGEPLLGINAGGIGSNLCVCHNTCKRAGDEHNPCARCLGEKFETGIACGADDLAVQEIGSSLSKVLHVHDGGEFEGSDSSSDLAEVCDGNDVLPLSLNSDSTDDLADVEIEVLKSSPGSPDGSEIKSSSGKSSNDSSITNSTPKLVSAMKGSRANQGINSKLSVKWAPDVYDPPVTSESHTLKFYRRSPKKKDYYKQKYSKSSSSRGSGNGSKKDNKHSRYSSSNGNGNIKDKKHSHHSSSKSYTADPRRQKVVPIECALLKVEDVPVSMAKAKEQQKCSTSYRKEQPMAALSRQLAAAQYKVMLSAWNQNQLAS